MQMFQMNTMENMENVMMQTNKTILLKVGLQLQGTSTTIEKMKTVTTNTAELWKKDDHAGRPKQQRKRDESERH